MTAQPRGISTPGYQPSPSQPIPNRYSQPQFGSGQAYSPRHVVPSSSPHQPQYFQQPGIASSAHDMYKVPGSVGTPPMMPSQQGYYRGQHIPRGPIPQMTGPREMYYPGAIMQRYPSMQGQTSPAQYQYPSQHQYHYMTQAPQIAHPHTMYGAAAYQPQYAQQPPPQQQLGPVQAQAMMPQQPTSQKREKKIIRIVDPTTNQDVTDDIIKGHRQDSLSTPPSGRSSATPPTGDVAAKFAAQVAAAAGTKSASPHFSPSVDTQPMMINQNTQLMQQQMQQEQQIVGSPSMGVSMVSPNPPYMNMPVPASSPRPPSVPLHSQPPQQYVQHMPPGPATHPSQMLSASPGLVAAPPQVQHSQMSMPPQIPDQMPPPVYQLPPQQTEQFGRPTRVPTRPMTSSTPENVHTYPARPQPVNVASGEPAAPSQHLSRPVIQQPPQAVPVVQTTAIAQMSKDITQTDSTHVPSQQTDSAPAATSLEVSPSPKEQEPIQSIGDDSQNGKGIVEVPPSVPSVQSEGANTTDIAAVSSETSVDDVAIVHTQEALTNTVAEKRADARPVEPVPSMPEKTEQTLEKEDTAIRLEDETPPSIPVTEDKPSSDASAKEISEVNPPPTAEKDIDTSALPTETAGDVKSVSDVAPSPPTPETEAVKQETSESSTSVTRIPVTAPSKATPLQSAEEKAPVPSAKTNVEKIDNKTELPPVQSQTKGQPKADEKQPSKFRVKSPELSKAPISESKQGKPSRKDSTSSDRQQKPLVSKTPSSREVPEKPVVNGLDTSTESESGDLAKKTEEGLPSAKITKTGDVKPTVESKSLKNEPARSLSVSSEKSTSEKSTESEKTNGVTSGKSKTAQQIKYEGDQWSPQNQEGKRQYDSNFLLQFQYRQTSLEKPKDLPNIDIVLEQPHNKIATPMQPMEIRPGTDFTPNYMRPGPRRPGGRQNSRDHGRMGGGGRSSMTGPGPRVIQKVVSINRDVELKTTENAWKPSKRDKNSGTKAAGDEPSEVIKEVRAILNKLTPSTFDALMQQVLSLKIDTETKLRGTIDLIFEKAIDEPNFSEAYANMCRKMTTIRVTPDEGTEQTVEFRKLLLTRCQKEFEKNKSDQENLLELKKKMEANTNKEIASQLKEEYTLAETRERRRTLGNIRFIGELFKLNMLTENIMHGCVMTLFKARDEDHLESLCRLLTTIGKDLDHQKGKQRTNQYFEQIKKIIQEKRTSSRVRFMLQDVFDLRLNNWVPRAVTTQGPKTISQIHQDAKQEQELLQLKLATTAAPAMKQGGRQQNRMGSRGHGEDGWTKVQTPAKPTRYDPTKMKLKPNQFDETKVTLGPSRVYGAGWKSGSAGSSLSKTGSAGYSPSGSMEKTQDTVRSNTPTSMKNRFSALSQGPAQVSDYDYARRQGGRPSSREGSRTGSRGSMGPPSSGSLGRTPRRDERSSVLEAARKLTSIERNHEPRQKSSRESSPSVKSQPSTPRQQQTAHKYNTDLNEEKMEQKSKNILEEFLSIVDFKEAAECIEELNAPPSLMHSLVHVAHEFTLEKKREARMNIGRLMAHLLKRGRLSVEQYVKGLAELLEMVTDYEIDVPMVWEYLAEQLSPVFEDCSEADAPLSCLAELAAPLRDEDKSGIFVAEVVKAVIKRVTLEAFVQRWHKSNMLWSKIFGKSDESVEAFLAQHNLSELSDSRSPPKSEQGGAMWQSSADKQYRLEQDITKLLEDGLPNEDIFVWVEKNVPLANVSEPPFLRALTIAVCKKAMDAEGKNVVEDRISERGIVLKKYIDTDPERELQAVYALQHMMVILDQPANVLRKFFDVLYNEDVISEQTFYKWEKCDDPNEQEGRGVAVASVNPFFTWLRTAELESD